MPIKKDMSQQGWKEKRLGIDGEEIEDITIGWTMHRKEMSMSAFGEWNRKIMRMDKCKDQPNCSRYVNSKMKYKGEINKLKFNNET